MTDVHNDEHKLEHTEYQRGDKDDIKMQSHVHMKETKDLPVDASSGGLVGGVTSALTSVLTKANDLLPAKLAETNANLAHKAIDLGAGLQGKASETIHNIAAMPGNTLHAITDKATQMKDTLTSHSSNLSLHAAKLQDSVLYPLKDSYEHEGVLAAAKTGLNMGKKAAVQAKNQVFSGAAGAKASILGKGEEAPKKHGRRRRGGRRHGNRKMKMKELAKGESESILDSLGDKAKELKEVVVDDISSVSGSAPSSGGILASAKSRVAGLVGQVSSLAAHTQAAVSGKISGLKGQAVDAKGKIQEKITEKRPEMSLSKDEKPSLDRKNELPALGTPTTPGLDVVSTKPLAVNAGDQSSLLDKAKFAVGLAKDTIMEKMDHFSENADDDSSMEPKQSNKSVLDKATEQLQHLKDAVSEKVTDIKKQ